MPQRNRLRALQMGKARHHALGMFLGPRQQGRGRSIPAPENRHARAEALHPVGEPEEFGVPGFHGHADLILEGRDLLPQLGSHRLIRLQDQHPIVAQGEVVEPPLEDPGDDPAVVVRQRVDLGVAAGDLDRPIRALGVEDEDLVGEAVDALQAALDVGFLVAGGDQDREGNHAVFTTRDAASYRPRQAAA